MTCEDESVPTGLNKVYSWKFVSFQHEKLMTNPFKFKKSLEQVRKTEKRLQDSVILSDVGTWFIFRFASIVS